MRQHSQRLPGVHVRERPWYLYLARDMGTKARPTTYEHRHTCVYGMRERGRTAKWAEDEVERELAEIDEWIA